MDLKHHRHTIRLRDYDYAEAGAYFITLVAHDRECLFGAIADAEMQLNDCGLIVTACWEAIPHHFPNVELDAFVVMPNHMHGIIVITDLVRATHASPPPNASTHLHSTPVPDAPRIERHQPRGPQSGSLAAIAGSFKSATAKRINHFRCAREAKVWQRNYYEHVIRDETALNRIRQYIVNNPAN